MSLYRKLKSKFALNSDPPSLTTIVGAPNLYMMFDLEASHTALDVVLFNTTHSSHFEKAHATIKIAFCPL